MSSQSIYLSYASSDAVFVEPVIRELQSGGFTLAVNRHTAPAGQPLEMTVREALKNAARFIVCFSSRNGLPTAYDAADLRLGMELMAAVPANEPWLIPVKLTPCDLPQLPIGTRMLRDLVTIDLHPDWQGGMSRLREMLPQPVGIQDAVEPRNPATARIDFKADSVQTGLLEANGVVGSGASGSSHTNIEVKQVVAERVSFTGVKR